MKHLKKYVHKFDILLNNRKYSPSNSNGKCIVIYCKSYYYGGKGWLICNKCDIRICNYHRKYIYLGCVCIIKESFDIIK